MSVGVGDEVFYSGNIDTMRGKMYKIVHTDNKLGGAIVEDEQGIRTYVPYGNLLKLKVYGQKKQKTGLYYDEVLGWVCR